MAIINDDNLTKVRQKIAKNDPNVIWRKNHVNDAVQAIEDWITDNLTSIKAAMDTATAPFIFTNAQKNQILKEWKGVT